MTLIILPFVNAVLRALKFLSCFAPFLTAGLSGWLAGKGMQDRRFLWGLLTGSLYFCVLAALTLIVNHGLQDVGNHFFTTLMICSGAGMLGGMLS